MPEEEALTSSSLRLRLVKKIPKLPNQSEFPISACLILEKRAAHSDVVSSEPILRPANNQDKQEILKEILCGIQARLAKNG